MIVLTDRREKQFRLDGFRHPVETVTLPIGDWSIKGFEDQIALEYKTKADLLQCLTQQREIERFERELQRGRGLDYFALVVEASFNSLVAGNGNGSRSKVSVAAALQRLMTFCVKYKIPVFFAGCRNHALWIVQSLLEQYWGELTKIAHAVKKASPQEQLEFWQGGEQS